MGIKDLSKFLHDKYPTVFEPIHISEYSFKKIAIDISLYLYQYKILFNDEEKYGKYGWLGAFIKLVACLRENEIHCVFIYDTGAPPEKEGERKERADAKAKTEKKVFLLENAIENYHLTGEVDPILIEFQSKRKLEQPRMLGSASSLNIKGIEFAVKNMRRQLVHLTKEDFDLTKKLFDILQVPYFDAPMESETTCSDLCIQGKVDAVLSEDTDVLAYGAPVFLTKINTGRGTCIRIKHRDVLTQMNLNSEEFLDFCIMCGTDYNKNIFKVGPVKALKLIETHRNIEEIAKTGLDVSILNYKRVRQLFREYDRFMQPVSYCGSPNFPELEHFVTRRNLKLDIDSLRKSFVHNIVVFEGDDEDEKKDDKEENEDVEIEVETNKEVAGNASTAVNDDDVEFLDSEDE